MHLTNFSILLAYVSLSNGLVLDHTWQSHQQCIGVNGPTGNSPDKTPTLLINFETATDGAEETGSVSIIVFNLVDEHLGGIRNPETGQKEVICTQANIARGLCESKQHGEFLLSDHFARKAVSPVVSRVVNISKPIVISYPILRSGYYCAATMSITESEFSGLMVVADPETPNLPAFRLPRLSVSKMYTGLLLFGFWLYAVMIECYNIRYSVFSGLVLVAITAEQALDVLVILLVKADRSNLLLSLILGPSSCILAAFRVWLGLGQLTSTFVLLSDHNLSKPGAVIHYSSFVLVSILEVASRWLDISTNESSRAAAVLVMVYGGCLAVMTMILIKMAYQSDNLIKSRPQDRRHYYHWVSVLIVSALFLLLVSTVVTLNLVALLFGGQNLTFGQNYWAVRGYIMDLPFQGPLNLLVFSLVVLSVGYDN